MAVGIDAEGEALLKQMDKHTPRRYETLHRQHAVSGQCHGPAWLQRLASLPDGADGCRAPCYKPYLQSIVHIWYSSCQ